jgi:3-deoxy-manno-octulosonate cytidylyltransferase (CMP-KDO synthetase)
MKQQTFSVVIPARYASSRFPGKPLHLINGRPLLLHTADRARESRADQVVVATDDERIRKICEQDGLDVEMTDKSHPSGTDRIAEVATKRQWADSGMIVGLQGDEPATRAEHLNLLAQNLAENAQANMATLCMPITNPHDYTNPHRVKVVRDHKNMALYFSRSAIPARRDQLIQSGTSEAATKSDDRDDSMSNPMAFLHIGLYAYRCDYLKKYQQLAPCLIEAEEQLEQLRVLYYGGQIHVGTVDISPARGVDHPDDIPALESILKVDH